MPGRAIDVGLGGAAATVPWWAQSLSEWAQVTAVVLGTLLVAVRLVLAVRECWGRCRRNTRKGS